jgi:hypothetical protein
MLAAKDTSLVGKVRGFPAMGESVPIREEIAPATDA